MLIQAIGTPRNHPKQKPFHDHVMSFHHLDGRIWFRHYQIAPLTNEDKDDPERQILTEIGPRLVLEHIRVFSGSLGGSTLYSNRNYLSPTALRVQARKAIGSKYEDRMDQEGQAKRAKAACNLGPDEMDEVFE